MNYDRNGRAVDCILPFGPKSTLLTNWYETQKSIAFDVGEPGELENLNLFIFELAFKTMNEEDYFRRIGLGEYTSGQMFYYDVGLDRETYCHDST